MPADDKLELVVEGGVNKANASIKTVNAGLSSIETTAAKSAKGAAQGFDGMTAAMVKGATAGNLLADAIKTALTCEPLLRRRAAGAALAAAEPLRDHGRDEGVQTDVLLSRALHQACVKGLGNSLSPLATGGSERAGRRNRIAKFLERQQSALQSVAPVNDRFLGAFPVRHTAGHVGKFDQVPSTLVLGEGAHGERIIFRSQSVFHSAPSSLSISATNCRM